MAVALIGAGCAAPADPVPEPTASAALAPTSTVATPIPPAVDDLQASFDQLAATLPADVGVTVSSGDQSVSYGTWLGGDAWSTIKVPLSIAALRRDPVAAEPFVTAAIVQSDNAAAEQLWSMLGDPVEAGLAVQAVLAEGGDPTTSVQTVQVRPPYSPYGQTDWPQQASARFAFGLPCLQSAQPVLELMQHVGAEQQWGLARTEGIAAKGGWGPEPDGGYLIRQVAVISDADGAVGVALAAKPTDGSFATGTAVLDQLAQWVLDHRAGFPTASCDA